MLDILEPFTSITRAVVLGIDPFAMRLVIFPLPLVHIGIPMDKPPSPIGLIISPVALIKRKIFPNLFASSVPHAVGELTDVFDPLSHFYGLFGDEYSLLLFVVFEWAQPVCDLLGFSVVEGLWLEVVVLLGV